MITVDVSQVLKELKEYHKEMVIRLENMVRIFAYNVAYSAIQNTPLGDYANGTKKYKSYYDARKPPLPQIEGLARGNWQYYRQGQGRLQILAGEASGDAALDTFQGKSLAYQLGQTFYIGNFAPYIESLEGDYSPQTEGNGIMKPTLDTITSIYQFNLPMYYKSNILN